MRLSPLLAAVLLVAASHPPASAADLSKIDRTLTDEPKYGTRSPKYCLLAFGPEARTLVWLVHDGDTLHVLDSPDGKAPKKWRTAGRYYSTFTIGDIREEGGKTLHKNLRFNSWPHNPRMMVDIDGHMQMAGRDPRGKLAFGASAKDAPVIHFNGPLTLDLFFNQQPLRTGSGEDITAVVGTHGIGPGTFAGFDCDAYPKKAWPSAVIDFPVKEGGKPVIVKVRLNED